VDRQRTRDTVDRHGRGVVNDPEVDPDGQIVRFAGISERPLGVLVEAGGAGPHVLRSAEMFRNNATA